MIKSACCLCSHKTSEPGRARTNQSNNVQPNVQKQLPIRRLHTLPSFNSTCKQLCTIICLLGLQDLSNSVGMWSDGNREAKEPDLVLAINPGLYSPTLYQCNDLLLNLLDGPPKSSAHPLELDSGEGLEIEHHGPVLNKVRQVMYVGAEVDIDIVTGLIHHVSQTIVSRKGSTYGVPQQELQNSLEVAVHVSFDQLPNIRLLLNISPKD